MDIRGRVGLNIKAVREARGWSQEELADRAELHRTYVSGGCCQPKLIAGQGRRP